MKKLIFILGVCIFWSMELTGQGVPDVYSNIIMDSNGQIYFEHNGEKIPAVKEDPPYTFSQLSKEPIGTETGLRFDFEDKDFNGTIYYGLIKLEGIRYPQPVFYKRYAAIKEGKASINILKNLSGKYDFIDWEETGKVRMGYRILNEKGEMLYDGKVNLLGKGPFTTDIAITEGPFINRLHPDRATLSFTTNRPVAASILVNHKAYREIDPGTQHEIEINGLTPNTLYTYDISYGKWMESYEFKTAPPKGSRDKFTFAYTSDSREGRGGGERALYGTNAYMMKKMMALASYKDAAFFQFTGDLINGYRISPDQEQLEYSNWKSAVSKYWRYRPIYVGMGNHEALMMGFEDRISVDRFPFEKESAEALFSANFVLPLNGPESEDGAWYDPNPDRMDFPSYKENVYYYTYGNVAMVVMNSNYWYAPSSNMIPAHSGNLHGYIMDQQLAWLEETINKLEADDDIDHIFVTMHTPAFPNGGHAKDDMWYHGDNSFRAYVNGEPLKEGIIERRDALLDIVINKSKKCVALFHGDEHNYSRLLINDKTPIYPEDWKKDKLKISRPFWQITNGAAGAPYYSQEVLPWSDFVDIFSTLNALMLLHVDGEIIDLEVINPDTLEEIEKVRLR
jgi:hypothetical protein